MIENVRTGATVWTNQDAYVAQAPGRPRRAVAPGGRRRRPGNHRAGAAEASWRHDLAATRHRADLADRTRVSSAGRGRPSLHMPTRLNQAPPGRGFSASLVSVPGRPSPADVGLQPELGAPPGDEREGGPQAMLRTHNSRRQRARSRRASGRRPSRCWAGRLGPMAGRPGTRSGQRRLVVDRPGLLRRAGYGRRAGHGPQARRVVPKGSRRP